MAEPRLKRAYDPPAAADGRRVLVDRMWPRGLKKSAASIDLWLKDLAPSTELRRWFGHDPRRWNEFCARYAQELSAQGDALEMLRRLLREGEVTLLFAARDAEHNNAVALRDLLVRTKPGGR